MKCGIPNHIISCVHNRESEKKPFRYLHIRNCNYVSNLEIKDYQIKMW